MSDEDVFSFICLFLWCLGRCLLVFKAYSSKTSYNLNVI